ncbi:MAG TPA: putative glycolipid-binding domain-containing protein [Longimicrobiaceae bacterium]|nr:putative glycolipid-binding domain-containing protein [Longimicrobiaceae bacterium]
MASEAILWRRLDLPGHDHACLSPRGGGWLLSGTALFAHEGLPCRLDYRVLCDAAWRTESATVEGWAGSEPVRVHLAADADRRWRLDGSGQPQVEGCMDVDLGFTPATNLLALRRLDLAVGAEAEVRSAWLDFPGFALEPLPQSYRRTSDTTYAYESSGGAFTAELRVNAAGFVVHYPGLWTEERASPA